MDWQLLALLLLPANWLFLDGVVILSEWSTHAGHLRAHVVAQAVAGFTVALAHGILLAIFIRWTRKG